MSEPEITTSRLRALVGYQVVMGFEDSMYGQSTLRWGFLRAVEATPEGADLVIDGYHDSCGIRDGAPAEGHRIPDHYLRSIKRHYTRTDFDRIYNG